MVSYRIRGARLVYRPAANGEWVNDGRFKDGDIVEFEGDVREVNTITYQAKEGKQCFRLGNNGSTLTPVARGSWETK